MGNDQCPICYSKLKPVDCTPCFDCGHLKGEAQEYIMYNVVEDINITLCNFCSVDFDSYKPEYLGLKDGKKIGFGDFNFVKTITHNFNEKDKFALTVINE